MENFRKKLSEKYLKGKGIEFGAQASPLFYNPNLCKVYYADKLNKENALKFFPELHNLSNTIIEPDFIIDFELDDLEKLIQYNFDFFIANHVIEHMANPILWLERIYNIMKNDAILYLAVPDKNYIFDKNRKLTTINHLWNDYQKKIKKVCYTHIDDFIIHISRDVIQPEQAHLYFEKIPLNFIKRIKLYKIHRKRSIHVHVWDQISFDQFLEFFIIKLNMKLNILDRVESAATNHEMIYVLQKYGDGYK